MRFRGWWRPALDGIAVLIGILTAFGIQAWWDVRQERVTIEEHLQSLSEAESGFLAHTDYLEAQDGLIRQILALSVADSESPDQLDSLTWMLGPFVPFEPTLPSLTALEVAGLGAVQSDDLRTAIGRYRDQLAQDLEEQASFAEYWRDEVSPYWDEIFNIRAWIDYAGSVPEDDPEAGWLPPELMATDLPRPSVDVAAREILSDRKFINQLARRIIRSWRIRSRHDLVIDEGRALQQRLLAGSG